MTKHSAEQLYKEVVALDSTWINSKKYLKGETVRTVRITPRVAKFNNEHPELTGCKYVPFDEAKTERELKLAKAKKLGLNVPKNISNAKLDEKIAEAEKQLDKPNGTEPKDKPE